MTKQKPTFTSTPTTDWWCNFFDLNYAKIGLSLHTPVQYEIVEASTHFLKKVLHLKKGDTVFDQCCGTGRISLPLAKKGFSIVGVDLIQDYTKSARAEAATYGLNNTTFITGDAFEFTTQLPCDAAINWFTSFGYAEDDELNLQMLKRVFESLKAGGKFALEQPSVPFILANFKPTQIVRVPSEHGEITVINETTIDTQRGMFVSKWSYFFPGKKTYTRQSETRMYMPRELDNLMKRAGFSNITFYGDIRPEPKSGKIPQFSPSSKRCIIVGTR